MAHEDEYGIADPRADRADPGRADKRAERERLNPARWRGHLDTQLPARNKVAKPKHHAALPVSDASTFMSALRKQKGSAASGTPIATPTVA